MRRNTYGTTMVYIMASYNTMILPSSSTAYKYLTDTTISNTVIFRTISEHSSDWFVIRAVPSTRVARACSSSKKLYLYF